MDEKETKISMFKRSYKLFKKSLIYIKLLILISLGIILFYLPSDYIKDYAILKLLILLFYYTLISIITYTIKKQIISVYLKRNHFEKDQIDNFTIGMERISLLLIHIIFVFIIFYVLGINFKQFLTSISLIAVALVLLFKDYISNTMNGFIIMFSDDIKIKEYIKIGDYKGRIVNITFLKTQIRSDEGDMVYIPNSTILNSELTNLSKSNTKKITFSFSLHEKYYGKVNKLERYIVKTLIKTFEGKGLLFAENILIKPIEIKNNETMFNVEIIVTRYNFKIENEIKNCLSNNIIKFLNKENTIA